MSQPARFFIASELSLVVQCAGDGFECHAVDLDAWCQACGTIITARLRMESFHIALRVHRPGDQIGWAADELARELGHDRELHEVERIEGAEPWPYASAPRSSIENEHAETARGRWLRVVAPVPGLREVRTLTLQAEPLDREALVHEHESEALTILAPALARAYAHRFGRLREHRLTLLDTLRPAQRLIAPLLAEGRSEASIAEQLGRSRHTIHDHARKIYRAWGVQSRMEMRDVWMQRPEAMGNDDATT